MTELAKLKEDLKPQLQLVPSGRTDVPEVTTKEAKTDLILSRRGTSLLRARSVNGDDRSARLYELASLLRDAGASAEESFVLVRASIWNKFKGRDDEVERLWEAVDRSRSNGASGNDLLHVSRRGHRGRGRKSVSVQHLLGQEVQPASFAVDRIWEHGGKGFLAGEPKTYKSLTTTDLAVSIATGTPFLGHFEVPKPGPVLIVQEENTKEIQHGRFLKILMDRDLGGKVHSVGRNHLECVMPKDCPVHCLDRGGFNFASKNKRRGLEQEVAALRPSLIILDPLQMMMGGLSLRNEGDVAKCLSWLNEIMESYKTSVLIVHHYNKRREEGPQLGGQRMLGSQALHAWLSCGLYVQRVNSGRLRVDREFRAFVEHTPFEIEFDSEDDEDIYSVIVHEQLRTKKQQKIVDLVSENNFKLTAGDLAEALEVSRRRALQLAEKAGLRKKRSKTGGKGDGGRPEFVFGTPSET